MDRYMEKLMEKIEKKPEKTKKIIYGLLLLTVLAILILSFMLIESKNLIGKFLGFFIFITAVKILVVVFKQIYS